MPNKPAKYGIKMWTLVDNVIYYTSNFKYTQPDEPFLLDNSALAVSKWFI